MKVYKQISIQIKNCYKEPLQNLNVSYFSFVRIFKDFSYFSIGTYPTQYMLAYREHVMKPHRQVIKAINIASLSSSNKSFIIWPGGLKQRKGDIIARISAEHNMGTKLTIVHKHENYFDIFFFVSALECRNQEIFFTAHENYFETFSKFFINRFDKIINNFPKELKNKYSYFAIEKPEFQIDNKNVQRFYQSMRQNSDIIMQFSKRKIQCLEKIIHGKTYKEIAYDLSLSPRTIESYMDNIRNKTGLIYKGELRDFWLKNYYL